MNDLDYLFYFEQPLVAQSPLVKFLAGLRRHRYSGDGLCFLCHKS